MTRTISTLLFFLLLFGGVLSAYPVLTDSRHELILQFKVFESVFAPGKYLLPGDADTKFLPYNNDSIPLQLDPGNRMVTLVSEFRISKHLSEENIGLFLPPFEYPASIYLNGNLLVFRGGIQGNYTNRTHYSKAVFLSPGLLRPCGESNVLTVQLYPKYGEATKPFGEIFISGYEQTAQNEFLRNLFGPHFSFALIIFCMITFAYFTATHVSLDEPNIYYYLFFALLNLAAALSQVNNAFSTDFSNVLLLEKTTKIGYNMTVLMVALFVFEYTKAFKNKKLIYGTLSALFIAGTLEVIVQKTYADVFAVYGLQVTILNLPVIILIFFYLIKYARLKTNRFANSLFMVFLFNIGTMYHDAFYYFNYNQKPYVNLFSYGIFVLNMYLIVILADAQMRLKKKAVESESALKGLYNNLEVMVTERTEQLHTTVDKLNKEITIRTATEEKLHRVSNTKDKLLSIIAHDLKNIFNSMISYSEFIADDIKKRNYEHIDEDMRKMQHSSKRAYYFLENILDWSVYELEVITYVPERPNLKEITVECIELFKTTLSEKGLTTEIVIPSDLLVVADTRMIKAVLRNLISNAIKYSFEQGNIIVSAQVRGEIVEVAVTDFGKGVGHPDDILVKELQPSERGTASEKGSGLGLYIVKDFLERHSASLKIRNNGGKGSIFSFELHHG